MLRAKFFLFLVLLLLLNPTRALAGISPDLNSDGVVGRADYLILIANFGRPYTIFDYNNLIENYGRTLTLASPSPQPTAPPSGTTLAFPGAEGFGSNSRGGRGGTIIHITNLSDSGPGSLRACLQATGPRYCIFDVSGTISAGSHLTVTNPFVTVAGETAPSPGITIKGDTLTLRTHDVIVRHLRFRVGNGGNSSALGDRDGFKFQDNTYNAIVDHVSVSWSVDENVSFWGSGIHDITVSNAIVSEALSQAGHPEGEHSKGILVGDGVRNVSLINLLASHNLDRNFVVKGGGSAVSINNLYYNFGESRATGVGTNSLGTIIGNVYIRGSGTRSNGVALKSDGGGLMYASDIKLEGVGLGVSPNTNSYPVWHPRVSVDPASSVEAMLSAHAGARPRDRDAVDNRIVNDVRNRSGRFVNNPADVGGWPSLAENHRVFPVPNNPNGDDDGDGYTNLEEVLHQSAATLD